MSNKIIYTAGDRTPYTYLIGWSKLDKWYYGSRTAKGCHPGDLWVKYFTSSKYVKALVKLVGEPDIKEVRKIFDDSERCLNYEYRALKRLHVCSNDRFLNKTESPAIPLRVGYMAAKCAITGDKAGLVKCDDPRVLSGELVFAIKGVKKTQSSIEKRIKTKLNIGEDGLNANRRSNNKTLLTQSLVGEDGLTGFQRKTLKRLETDSKVRPDGLTGAQYRGLKIAESNALRRKNLQT